jgi:3',5'-cyclic AMP phosphodiesterase CpdA
MEPLIIGQISDLHVSRRGEILYGVIDTGAALRRCVDSILALERWPDLVLVTGDLAEGGLREEYRELRSLLAPLPMPWYVIPGNHDDRTVMRDCFRDHGYLQQWAAFAQYAIDDWPLRIVALDTVIPGEPGGRLCEERLDWLERTLAREPGKPTAIVMHHPPFRTWIEHMDAMALESPGALAEVLSRHAQVQCILCGHLHRPIEARFAGIPASTCPSPAHQVALDLEPSAPARLILEPPAYRLHLWSAETGVVSHTMYVGAYPGPYPFD